MESDDGELDGGALVTAARRSAPFTQGETPPAPKQTARRGVGYQGAPDWRHKLRFAPERHLCVWRGADGRNVIGSSPRPWGGSSEVLAEGLCRQVADLVGDLARHPLAWKL
ncbi:MAG: hypothetical protein LC808_21555 [Actinobacteria bacterium]|nr:hypothetical protein [Actinomycetota bacterium]